MKCGLRNKDGPIFRFQFTSVSFYTHYLGHSSTSSEYCAFYTMKPDVQYQIFRVRGLCAKQRKTNKGIELILILTIFNSRKTEPFLYKRSTSMTRSLHFITYTGIQLRESQGNWFSVSGFLWFCCKTRGRSRCKRVFLYGRVSTGGWRRQSQIFHLRESRLPAFEGRETYLLLNLSIRLGYLVIFESGSQLQKVEFLCL